MTTPEALDRMRAFLRSEGFSDEDVADFEASLGDVDAPPSVVMTREEYARFMHAERTDNAGPEVNQ